MNTFFYPTALLKVHIRLIQTLEKHQTIIMQLMYIKNEEIRSKTKSN